MGDRKIKLLLFLSILVTASSAAFHPLQKSESPIKPTADTDRGKPSSAVFQVFGNVYPDGLFFVSMGIGNPPRTYFLDIDTGSDLTWLQCDAPCVSCNKVPHPYYLPPKGSVVPCEHELCVAVQLSTGKEHNCKSPTQCDYQIVYADRSSSMGVLVNDTFSLRLLTDSGAFVRPHLVFGCGYDQRGGDMNAPKRTDGILGLGNGNFTILSQLRAQGVARNVVGHCLGRRGGGYLFFGDDLVPRYGGVTWAPMSQTTKHYSPGKANLYLGKKSLTARALPAILDSGGSFTYFPKQAYEAFLSALKKDLINAPLKEVEDSELSVCWKGAAPFKSVSDVNNYFPDLMLNFMNGKKAAPMEIPAENYLIISKHGNACLGILNGNEVKLYDFILIGDVSMQDVIVIYDNEKKQIGWARTSCNRLPKSGTSPL